jgi:RimJ/RimL family protein N-acetyltransferase
MIAEEYYQKRGLGKEASCLMLLYGAKCLGIRRFFCKINEDNEASRVLFETKLGFRQCDYAECFRQVELELKEDIPEDLVNIVQDIYGGTMVTFACPLIRDHS